MPQGDEAAVVRWVWRALSPVLHPPFDGPCGTTDHEVLTGLLRHAEGWDHIDVEQDDEVAVERVMLNMVRAALPLDDPREAALTNGRGIGTRAAVDVGDQRDSDRRITG